MTTENTDTTTVVDNEQDEQEREEQSQEEQDAEAGFSAGFNRVAKKDDDQGAKPAPSDAATTEPDKPAAGSAPEKSDAEKEAEKKAAEEAERKRQEEEQAAYAALPESARKKLDQVDTLIGTVNKLSGHIGGLANATKRIETALANAKTQTAKAGGDAPSDAQVQAAMSDPKAWDKLKEDYPDWAGPVEAELKSIRVELAKRSAAPAIDVAGVTKQVTESLAPSMAATAQRMRELAFIDFKHEGWEETINTPEFKTWLQSQPADVKALAASEKGRDAVKLLDTYKGAQEKAAQAAQDRQRRASRMAAAETPKGAAAAQPAVLSDEEAFARGANRVLKQKR